MSGHDKSIVEKSILRQKNGTLTQCSDQIVVEAPLQIEVEHRPISITMRTPGDDIALAVGFFFTEGIIKEYTSIEVVNQIDENIVNIEMVDDAAIKTNSLERNFYSTSSCGVCGKASVDAIRTQVTFLSHSNQLSISESVLYSLQEKLLHVQSAFEATGGLHASALFDPEGKFLFHSEDVGRHNALDKLIGHSLIAEKIPLNNHILLLSGRASFELIQKAAMAGIAIVVSVGAPSSLAIEMSEECGMTLVGFLKKTSYNVYCGSQRIKRQA